MIPIYTRYLTPGDYGVLELLDLTLEVIGMIVGVRLGASLIRYYHHYDDPKDQQEVFTTALIFTFFFNLILLVVLELFSHPIALLVSGEPKYIQGFQIIFICLTIQNIYLVSENYLLLQKRSVLYSNLSILTMFISLSCNIIFVIGYKFGFLGIIFSMLIAKAVNCIIVVPITLKNVPLRFSWEKLIQMVKFALPLIPAAVGLFLIHFSDRFFVKAYCPLEELGLYSLGYKFGMILSVLISAPIFRIWNTQRFEIYKTDSPKYVFKKMFTYYSFIVSMAGLVICVFIDDVLAIMVSSSFQGARSVVPLIVSSYVFYGMANYFSIGIMLKYKTKYMAYIQMSVAILNLLFNAIFIPPWGIIGAGISTVLSFFCLMVFTFTASQKLYHIPFEYGKLLILELLVCIAVFIAFQINTAIWLSIVLKIMLCFLLLLALLLFRFFETNDVQHFRKIFNF